MAEEVSPESKLYVKEEIEKSRKEIKEEVEKVKSKATRTFTTVAMVIGLLTGVGVYGLAVKYMDDTIQKALDSKGVTDLKSKAQEFVDTAEGLVTNAENSYNKIVKYETDANYILSSLSSKMIIGTIVPYGGKIADSEEPIEIREGWYFCNGALLNRNDYPRLYEVIGRAFGGAPDPNTFNLPDLRGRVAVGAGSGEDLTPRELGKTGGEEKHTLTIDEMPKHTHDWLRGTQGDDSGSGRSAREYVDTEGTIPKLIGFTGDDQPHNNMQPFLVVNYIIKAR